MEHRIKFLYSSIVEVNINDTENLMNNTENATQKS